MSFCSPPHLFLCLFVCLLSGRWVSILNIKKLGHGATVYNFEVADNHDYFVGSQGVLVHNQSMTTVGRWMDEAEYEAMLKTGMVQESFTGTTHVATPADPTAFLNQAKLGAFYVEFDVPAASVKPTQPGWGMIVGPNTIYGRLAARQGQPIPQIPSATNITHKATRIN